MNKIISKKILLLLALVIFNAHSSLAADDDQAIIDRGKAVELVVQHNSGIKRAEQYVEQLVGFSIYCRSFLYPKIDYLASFDMVEDKLITSFNNQRFGTRRDWNMRVEINQPLFTGGRGSNTHSAALLREDAARYALQQVTNEAIYTAQKLYLDVLLARENLSVQSESVGVLSKLAANEKKKFEVGSVSKLNLLRAEVALANGKVPYIKAKNALKLAQDEFNRFISDDTDGLALTDYASRISGNLEYHEKHINFDVLRDRALTFRPELKRLELLVEAANHDIDAEFANYIPDFFTTASYNIEKSRFSEELDDTLRGWRLGFDAQWKIFDSLETHGNVKQAKSKRETARIDLKQERLDINVEVRRAFADFDEAVALANASTTIVAQAQEAYKLARARFDAESATQTELLDAQLALREAQLNRAEALYRHNLASANIQRVSAAAIRFTDAVIEQETTE